jgi:hypothetical protein
MPPLDSSNPFGDLISAANAASPPPPAPATGNPFADLIPAKPAIKPAGPTATTNPFADLIPKPPSWTGVAREAGWKGLVRGVTETAEAPTAFRDRPPEKPDTSPVGRLLSQPISRGYADPKWWIAHIAHGAAASSPSLALGLGGAAAGGAVGGPVGGLIGGAGGFATGSAAQTVAPAYIKARQDGLDHDAAVKRAMTETGIAALFGAAMGAAPVGVAAAIERPLSRALAEIFVVQPTLGVGEAATTGAVEGKMPSADELGTTYAEQAGMGVGLVGAHAAARRLIGRGPNEPSDEAVPEAPPKDIVPPPPPPPAPSATRQEPPPVREGQEPAPGLDAEKLRSFGITQLSDGTWRTPDGKAVWDRNGNPLNRTAETWTPPPVAEPAKGNVPGGTPATPEAPAAAEARPEPPIPAAVPTPGSPPLTDYGAEYEANRARVAAAERDERVPPATPDEMLEMNKRVSEGDVNQGGAWHPSSLVWPHVEQEQTLRAAEALLPPGWKAEPRNFGSTNYGDNSDSPGRLRDSGRNVAIINPEGATVGLMQRPGDVSRPWFRDAVSGKDTRGVYQAATEAGEAAAGVPPGTIRPPFPPGPGDRMPAANEAGAESGTPTPNPATAKRMPRSTIREDTAFIPSSGASFPIEYAVVEARDLIPSHNEDLSPNPAFPQALQPRSRERAETEAQINAILNGDPSDPAATFRPELMGENPDATNGAPIVGWEGYVESGNARTIALRRAYSRKLPQAERYREYLAAQGYPVEGMKEPVLVRINRAPMNMPQREQLARDLNVAPQATMSATDRAMADAAQIPPDLLRLYGDGDIFSAGNAPFWRSILTRIAKPAELPALTDPEGGLSPAGQTRLRNAVLAKAYGDPQFVAALVEDADSNIKAIGNALLDAAPRWAQLRQAVADGRIDPSLDVTSSVIEAVRLIRYARDSKRNVAEFMKQRGMFDDGVSPNTEGVLSWLLGAPDWTRRYSRDKMSLALGEYAASAMREPGMLGTAPLSSQELIENARQRAQGAAGDLFSPGLAEPPGAGIVRGGAGEGRPGDEGLSAADARRAAQEGGEGDASLTKPARSTTDEAREFASKYPIGPEGTHQAAVDYVVDEGRRTGHEYFAAVDHTTDDITHAGTSESPSWIRFDKSLIDRLWDPREEPLAIHHNHPLDLPLSAPDLVLLAMPGAGSVTSHGPDGRVSSAGLTLDTRWRLAGLSPQTRQGWLTSEIVKATNAARDAFAPLWTRGMLSSDRTDLLIAEGRNRLLAASGVIDHISSTPVPPWATPLLVKALTQLTPELSEEIAHVRLDRSTGFHSPADAVAAISRAHVAASAGRPAGAVGGAGGAGGLGAQAGRGEPSKPPPPELSGIDDEKSTWPLEDLFDDAEREIAMDASGIFPPRPPPPPGFTKRMLSVFGANPDSPWRERPWMLPWERLLGAPSNMARYNVGGVSTQKWIADRARDQRSEVLFSTYKESLAPFTSLTADEHQKINAVLEIQRLKGEEPPLDGAPISATNDTHTLAYHSKPGETLTLDTPRLIAGYTAVRKTLRGIYNDYIAATAKRHGWEGEPTSAAINARAEAERAFGRPGEARRLEFVGKIVGLAEFARRNAYVPFMREGDYYFRVKPKTGTPDRPGVPGWTGEGFAPTVWNSRIQSRSGLDKLTGQPIGPSATIRDNLAEIRKTFPESQYTIEHGYFKPEENQLRKIGIETIEDLFDAVGRDFRREWRARVKASDNPEAMRKAADQEEAEHRLAVETIMNQIYERLRAGFKHESLNIPGYSEDLSHSIARYTVWLSNHIADLEYRQRIEAADQVVESSPDAETRGMWQQRARELAEPRRDYGTQRLRNAAFYWALGGNFASTIKVMLHGPMLGWPLLSTGVGKAQSAKEYFPAFAKLLSTVRLDPQVGFRLDPLSQARNASERALIEENLKNGRLHASGAEELGFGAIHEKGMEGLEPRHRMQRRVLKIWGANIAAADQTIRGALLLSAYRVASNPATMARLDRIWTRGDALWRDADWNKERRAIDSELAMLREARDATGSDIQDDRITELAERRREIERQMPARFAEFITDRGAGIWGSANRPEFARHPAGGLFYQFRNYELNYLSTFHQLMWHMGPEGKHAALLMLASLGLMAGAGGIPFAQDIEGASEWIYKFITGIDPNLNERFLRWMETDPLGLGKDFGKYVLYGVPGQMPHGVAIGQGLSFGDLISRNARSVLDVAPSLSIFAGGLQHAAERYRGENPTGDLTAPDVAKWLSVGGEVMPNAIKNLVKAYGVYPEEGVRTMAGKTVVPPWQVTAEDKLARAVGLTSGHIEKVYQEWERDYRLGEASNAKSAALNKHLASLATDMVNAEHRGDKAAAKAAEDEATRIATAAGGDPKAHARVFRDAVKAAQDPMQGRLRHLPKAVRGEAAKPLFIEPGAP